MKGIVFNIQHFSIHDGNGIRTTVFLKGCPLRCLWCSNPESQRLYPEAEYIKASCINCKCCITADCDKAITVDEQNQVQVHVSQIEHAENYRDICPAKALTVMGEYKTVDGVIDQVEKDSVFYQHSFGGMTLSGGEPLVQADFTEALLMEAQKRHIHTNIETTGFAPYETVHKVFSHLDSIIYDIKFWNDDLHRKYTGVSNALILDNFRKMREDFRDTPVLVRTPVIPGVNDREEEIENIRKFIQDFPNVSYELLKYHRLGQPKYEALEREWEIREKELDEEHFQKLQEIAKL